MSAQIRLLIFFTFAYFLSYFYRSANAIIAPDLSHEIGLGAAELGLMTSLFYAAFALVQIPLGEGLDRWGPRWMTPALMLVGVIGSLLFAFAPSFPMLALGRALIGVGMAGILMGALKAFSEWFPSNRFATISGLLVGIGSSGAWVAATPLALSSRAFGWRSIFAFGAVVIALAAISIFLWTRNAPPGVRWHGRTTIGGSMRAIFSNINFMRIAPLAFFTNGTVLAFQGLWAGPYLFDILRLDKIAAGNILFFMSLGVTAGFLLSGWLSDHWGLARIVLLGSSVLLVCQLVLAARPPQAVVTLTAILFGVFGGFNIMLLTQPRYLFPPSLTGRALTAVNLFAIGGAFVLQWCMGAIIGAFPIDLAGHYPPEAHTLALLLTAAGTFLAILWYLPMLRSAKGDISGLTVRT
jgi:MFS family permease